MNVRNRGLLAAIPALKELVELPLPVRASFRVARLVRQVEAATQDVEDARLRLVERFAERDAEGKYIPVFDAEGKPVDGSVNVTDPEGFRREIAELLGMETEIAAEPLSLADLGVKAEISPAVLLGLGPLLADALAPEVV
jgi:hypothetical protein